MALNLTVAGALAIPLEDGGSVAPIDLTVLGLTFTSRADFVRNYTTTVTDDSVDFGTLTVPGAKGLIVKCKAGACTIKFNGGADAWPLAPGGYFLWINPATPFPTAALISTTGPASVVFIAVG